MCFVKQAFFSQLGLKSLKLESQIAFPSQANVIYIEVVAASLFIEGELAVADYLQAIFHGKLQRKVGGTEKGAAQSGVIILEIEVHMPAGVMNKIAHLSLYIELVYVAFDHLSEVRGDLVDSKNHQFFHEVDQFLGSKDSVKMLVLAGGICRF